MEWLIVFVLVGLLWLRQALLVVVGVTLLLLYALFADGNVEYLLYDLWNGLNRDILLALPMFLLAHTLISTGPGAWRLTDFLTVLCSPLPVGLALGSLLSMVSVSALCGSPAVALLAIGPVLNRAMLAEGYAASFSIGLLCTGSILGLLLPLSVPMLVYSAVSQVEIFGLLVTASIAALCLLLALFVYSAFTNWNRAGFAAFSGDLRMAGIAALPVVLPIVVLIVALISPGLSIVQAATSFFCASLIAELGFYRGLNKKRLFDSSRDLIVQLGRVLPLVLFSVSLSAYLIHQQIPQQIGGWLAQLDIGSGQFLGLANFVLLLVGLLLDTISALLVVTPLLAPTAEDLGLAAEPFGVMLVLNLSLGYLTPPNGLVLIAAMLAFRESFNAVLAAVVPFMAVLWTGVLALALAAL